MTPTIYTTDHCQRCNLTKLAMDQRGIRYDTVNVSEDTEALGFVRSLGYAEAPVVVVGDQHWSGFRPDRIEELAQEVA